MRNYTIPKYPEYDENIRMLENTDPADADSVFNPLFSKMINNTAAIRSKFNGVTMKDEEILNIPNTRDYDYLSLELGGNTRVTPENPDLPISPDNVASIESVGENGNISVVSTNGNLLGKGFALPEDIKILGGTELLEEKSDGYIKLNMSSNSWVQLQLCMNKKRMKPNTSYSILIDIAENTTKKEDGITPGTILLFTSYAQYSGGTVWEKYADTLISNGFTGRIKLRRKTKNELTDSQYLYFLFLRGNNDDHIIKELSSGYVTLRVMIFEGDVDINTPYQEGIVNTYSVPLKGTDGNTLEPLRSIKDYKGNLVAQDKVMKKNGIWCVERNIQYKVFDGTEKWIAYNIGNLAWAQQFNCTCAANAANNIAISNQFLMQFESGPTANNSIHCHVSDIVFYVAKNLLQGFSNTWSKSEREAALKLWVKKQQDNGTPVIAQWQTKSVVYEILHQDTQTILNNLEKTYNGTTVIMGTDEVSPLITSTYARGSLSTKQINGCEVNDKIIGDRNLLTASKTVELINSIITERLEATK